MIAHAFVGDLHDATVTRSVGRYGDGEVCVSEAAIVVRVVHDGDKDDEDGDDDDADDDDDRERVLFACLPACLFSTERG